MRQGLSLGVVEAKLRHFLRKWTLFGAKHSRQYPYLPPHVSEPKEIKKLYLVELPPSSQLQCPCRCHRQADSAETFAVPANMKLIAIPIMEFYDNAARYGPQFAGLPYVLGRSASGCRVVLQADGSYWLPAHQKAADLAMEHTDFQHHF